VLKKCFEFTGVTVGLCGVNENLAHNSVQKSMLILKSTVGLRGHQTSDLQQGSQYLQNETVALENASLASTGSGIL